MSGGAITKVLSCPFVVLLGLAAISIFSLAAALTAEVAFGLEPCILCVYQRIPFAVVFIMVVIVFLMTRVNKKSAKKIATPVIGLCGLTFLVNSGIAFYHSGVELKWWRSIFEGCAAPDLSGDPQNILENILSAPTSRCDEIPWADPILGLSMANYNVFLCFGLFLICVAAVFKQRQTRSEEQTRPESHQNGK